MSHLASEVPGVASVRVVTVESPEVLLTWKGVQVSGGYGSDLALGPGAEDHFYLLTDRGPNFDTPQPEQKGFVLPAFVPRIGGFRLEGEVLRPVGGVEVRGAGGEPVSGLPHPPGPGSTGETAVNLAGEALTFDRDGIDPEGLAVLPDGSFWLAEEYGPQLLHLDPEGRILERVDPWSRPHALPRVLARRRPNRGFEGLALLPDQRTLVAILQSALDNPSPQVRRTSTLSRILTFDTVTGGTRQHLYLQEAPELSNSAVCVLDQSTLLVIEHDALYPVHPRNPAAVKRVYRVDLGNATDVSDPEDHPGGMRIGGRTLEQLSDEELAAAGIVPAAKTLVLDLLAIGYPHNKPEGLAVLGDRTLAILNDDDFRIESDGAGGIVPKILPATGELDRNTLWLVTLDAPLR